MKVPFVTGSVSVAYPWLLSLFSHISCYPRKRFAKASVVCDAVIAHTGRRRGRTGKASHGAAPACARPRGRRARRAELRAPAPGQPLDLLRHLRGPPLEMRHEGKAGASPCSGRDGAAPQLGALARAAATSAPRRGGWEKPFAYSRHSVLFGKGHLCTTSTATALERPVQPGLGQTAQA